jgi:LPS O-antigen subunit length determinant protein (WzzB/FepE family)
LSKDTPTFSVLDPVKVPKVKTGPKKSLYIIGSFFIGLVVATVWILGRKSILDFSKEFKKTS